MHIVQLQKYRAKDIGIVLKFLTDRYELGNLRGVVLCSKDIQNAEEVYVAGCYRDDPAHALSAALKLSRRIEGMED